MKQKKNNTSASKWYNGRKWAAMLSAAALLAAYGFGSRALFTGSLQQYAITIALVIFCINRFAHVLIVTFNSRKASKA